MSVSSFQATDFGTGDRSVGIVFIKIPKKSSLSNKNQTLPKNPASSNKAENDEGVEEERRA